VADVTPLGHGRYLVTRDGPSTPLAPGRQSIAYAIATRDAQWVFLEGRVYVIDAAPRATARRGHDDDQALASPMPAKVAAVNVTAGQQVARGDLLVMLEAMKMELPIRAPRDARVKSIACQPGELVQPGVPLLELE
jgi:biotin carboxyl carrier protein